MLTTQYNRHPNVGFMAAPPGQFAYQNAYWLPDAVQALEVILPEPIRAEADMHQQQQRAIVREAQVQEALNLDHRDGLQLANIPLGCKPY